MNTKIAIIGYGVVGKAVEQLIKNHYDYIPYSPSLYKTFPKKQIDKCYLSIICVPTNEKKDGSCDTSIVEEMARKIDSKYILIKSTVEPGTTERLIKETKKRIVFSPEYIGESSYFHPYWKTMEEEPFFILGGEGRDCNAILDIFEPMLGPTKTYYTCSSTEAEIIKYMENCFFATKVTFVNEFYEICKTFGADWHKVREGWLLDPRINKMHTSVFTKKRGFGGKCYPKDINAIILASSKKGYNPRLLQQVNKSNKFFRSKTK